MRGSRSGRPQTLTAPPPRHRVAPATARRVRSARLGPRSQPPRPCTSSRARVADQLGRLAPAGVDGLLGPALVFSAAALRLQHLPTSLGQGQEVQGVPLVVGGEGATTQEPLRIAGRRSLLVSPQRWTRPTGYWRIGWTLCWPRFTKLATAAARLDGETDRRSHAPTHQCSTSRRGRERSICRPPGAGTRPFGDVLRSSNVGAAGDNW